jgi:hypothetical protein
MGMANDQLDASRHTLRTWRTTLRSSILYKSCVAFVLLIVGLLSVWALFEHADRIKRTRFLESARIIAASVDPKDVEKLVGNANDLSTEPYKKLKEQFISIREAEPSCRFVYLLGCREDGSAFFYLDSEPTHSNDYSAPGSSYDESTTLFQRASETKMGIVEGPLKDDWGTWVSSSVPIFDPTSSRAIAVLGIDYEAAKWKWSVAAEIALPALLIFSLTMGLMALIVSKAPAKATAKPILRRLLPALTFFLLALFLIMGLLLRWQYQEILQQKTAGTTKSVLQQFQNSLILQSDGLSMILRAITQDDDTRQSLIKGDRERLLSQWKQLYANLRIGKKINQFLFMDAQRKCIARLHKPQSYGDPVMSFTVREAARKQSFFHGLELDNVGIVQLSWSHQSSKTKKSSVILK